MSRLSNRTARLRQLEELLLLSPGGLSAAELAKHLEVNRRTVYRDLDFLSFQGVPLWQQEGRFGLNRTRYLATIHLSYHEALALSLAGLQLTRILDKQNPHVISALRHLAATLPETPGLHLKRAADRMETYRRDPNGVSILEKIVEGWGNGQKIRVGYRSPNSGALRERIVAPYALEPTASGVYLIGHDDWAGDIRTFKLNRLESAELLDEPYTIPEDFDAEVYLSSSWGIMTGDEVGEVVLRFSATAAPFITERYWHASQQLEIIPDGGCVLHVRVSEPLEMQPWIRSWGSQVEVLAPDWLRLRIATELQQAAQQYASQALASI